MRTADDLRRALRGIDRKGYPAYKSLAGGYRFDGFSLFIDHVQGDPFAVPSSVRVEVPLDVAGFPADMLASACTRVALADYLTRQLGAQMARVSFRVKGSGKSGLVATSRCGQEVLERSACVIDGKAITARFQVGFPAHGRTIDARGLEQILLDLVPRCVRGSLLFRNLNAHEVQAAVNLAEDQASLRQQMQKAGLVAFVANGSLLPRESGASDRPLEGGVAFVSPPSLEQAFTLPYAGEVRGMGIPRGITLVVGGGYHGKSTLLEALQRGVYNHVLGDGREFVLADATALKLRAEDGRAVRDVDVSLFINNLPNGKDTTSFSTGNASGSTSQAAAVVEGIEAGTRLLLIDEDTSATNFMVRDELMSSVIARDKEPITPFLERARGLYEQAGVSTILVAGSSGAFFAIADHVIQMDCYQPRDITDQVKSLCAERGMPVAKGPALAFPQNQRTMPRFAEGGEGEGRDGDDACERFTQDRFRSERDGGRRGWEGHDDYGSRDRHGGHDDRDRRGGYDDQDRRGGHDDREGRAGRGGRGGYGGRNGRGGRDARDRRDGPAGRARDLKVRASGCDTLSVGKASVDVRYVEQLVDSEQTLALAYLLRYAFERLSDEERTLGEAVEALLDTLDAHGWEPFCGSYVPCGLAKPRKQEIFAALNRFRG